MPAPLRLVLHVCGALVLGVAVYAATASGVLPPWLFLAVFVGGGIVLAIWGATRETRRLETEGD